MSIPTFWLPSDNSPSNYSPKRDAYSRGLSNTTRMHRITTHIRRFSKDSFSSHRGRWGCKTFITIQFDPYAVDCGAFCLLASLKSLQNRHLKARCQRAGGRITSRCTIASDSRKKSIILMILKNQIPPKFEGRREMMSWSS